VAPINPPAYLQAGTYSARLDRLAQASLLAPAHGVGALAIRGGVRPTPSNTGLQVTQRSTPAMFVTIGAGMAYVPPQSATGGAYIVENDASHDVAIAASHASLARRDLVVARVYDSEVSGVLNEWRLEVVTGTPSGSPTLPATPSGALALAQVQVAAASSTVLNAAITDLRVYTTALGGTIPALSSAMPANPYEGMAAYQTDLNRPAWHNGASWHSWTDEGYITQAGLDALTWSTYTPAWGASSVNPTLGNGTITGRYFKIGKLVQVQVALNFGSTTNVGSGLYSFSLPVTPKDGFASTDLFGAGGGVALFADVSGGPDVQGGQAFLWDVGVSNWRIRMIDKAGGTVSHNTPIVWATGDDLNAVVTYEAL
jgi:hypothetical protein